MRFFILLAIFVLINTPAFSGDMEYRVYLGEKDIGSHTVTMSYEEDITSVNHKLDLIVKLGFITLYDYEHNSTEKWDSANKFLSARGVTKANSESWNWDASQGNVTINGKSDTYEDNALPATWWNPKMLEDNKTLIFVNPHDGRKSTSIVKRMPDTKFTSSKGSVFFAKHWKLTGDIDIELYYNAYNNWIGSSFSIDGHDFVYRCVCDNEELASLAL